MGATTGPKSFAQYGDTERKGSQSIAFRQRYPQLFNLLDSVPFQAFSPIGKRNISRRFNVTEQVLSEVLLTYVHPDAPTVAEQAADLASLLGVIQAVVKPAPKRRPATRKVSKKGGTTC